MREFAVAVGRGLHARIITAKEPFNNQLPVGGVLDTDSDIVVIKQRLRRIHPQPISGSGTLIVKYGFVNIPIGNIVIIIR